jgi:hypothetical protein
MTRVRPKDEPHLASVVADVTGAEVAGIELVRTGLRSRVWRCTLKAPRDAPQTVIARQLDPDSDLGLTDWAVLAFLGMDAASAGVVPRVIGGGWTDRVVVLDDLGSSGSLESLLAGADSEGARTALLALAECYGRLHAATAGREAEFDTVCARIPGSRPPGRRMEVAAWRDGLGAVAVWASAAGIEMPAGVDAAFERIAGVMHDPGEFLALTHGDPAPSNNHVAEDPAVVRLLDFEYGAYRHALYDMTAWEVLCPVPRGILDEMLARYRAVSGWTDDASFRADWGAVAAYRTLAILGWIPAETIRKDGPWVGTWSRRDAVLAAIRRLRFVLAESDDLAAVARFAARLDDRLSEMWPARPVDLTPDWPALSRRSAP